MELDNDYLNNQNSLDIVSISVKTCSKCLEVKSLDSFYNKKWRSGNWGKHSRCKKCVRIVNDSWAKTNYKKYSSYSKNWKLRNPSKRKEYLKTYKEKNKDKISTKRREYVNKRRKTDLNFKLRDNLRRRLNEHLKTRSFKKLFSVVPLLGCSIPELKAHLEAQFLPGMSWENYGQWHIDHIFPLSKIDLSNPALQHFAFHYSNLRPLAAEDNRKKSNKVTD